MDSCGCYGYDYFDCYWTDDDRVPFFILVNGHYAGFVLVNEYAYALKESPLKCIGEFFVMRRYRKMGVGARAAKEVFDRFKVNWEVAIQENNAPSRLFWERVISDYTKGEYQLISIDREDCDISEVFVFS